MQADAPRTRVQPHPPMIIRVVAIVAALYGWSVLATTPFRPGAIGVNLNALGTDWMVFYGGAHWFFAGHLGQLFDGDRFTDYLNAQFGAWLSQPIQFRPWVYPPSYLLLMLPFGLLSFASSYVAFQLATMAMLAAALWHCVERKSRPLVLVAALLGPAAAITAGMGQNAFLTAALLIAGLHLARRRPEFAGALLGLATIKPQFWLLVPIALAAQRQWRALTAAIAVALLLVAISGALFGIDCWRQWLDLARHTYADPNGEWMTLGRLWGISVYACLVTAGAPEIWANTLQTAATLAAIAAVYRAYRSPALQPPTRLAILLVATILAAPHSSLSDALLLAVAAALWIPELVAAGAPLASWTLALALWLVALINPPILSPGGRLTPLLLMAFLAVILWPVRPRGLTAVAARQKEPPSCLAVEK